MWQLRSLVTAGGSEVVLQDQRAELLFTFLSFPSFAYVEWYTRGGGCFSPKSEHVFGNLRFETSLVATLGLCQRLSIWSSHHKDPTSTR